MSMPPQPEDRFIIDALQEENRSLRDNNIYLVAVLRQLQAEYRQAEAAWAAEKESLKMERAEWQSSS